MYIFRQSNVILKEFSVGKGYISIIYEATPFISIK